MALKGSGPTRIAVSIDELVLDRVAPADPLVAQAIEHAITQALPPGEANIPGIDPVAIAAAAGAAVASSTDGAG